MGMTERGGFPNELNLRRGQAVCLVGEVAERALQLQGFGGAGAGGLNAGGIPFHEAMDRYKNTVRKILRMLERQSPD
jgi:hypothetical protein